MYNYVIDSLRVRTRVQHQTRKSICPYFVADNIQIVESSTNQRSSTFYEPKLCFISSSFSNSGFKQKFTLIDINKALLMYPSKQHYFFQIR